MLFHSNWSILQTFYHKSGNGRDYCCLMGFNVSSDDRFWFAFTTASGNSKLKAVGKSENREAFRWNVWQIMALFTATGRGGVSRCRQHLTTVWADCVPVCFFAAAWSWTSSSRRTNCSRWWRGFALQRTATSPPCLTPRRPSPPPRNASPKLTPRSMLAGNFGSCEHTESSLPP